MPLASARPGILANVSAAGPSPLTPSHGSGAHVSSRSITYTAGSMLIMFVFGSTISADSAGNTWALQATGSDGSKLYTAIGVGTSSTVTLGGSSTRSSFVEVPGATTVVQAVAAAASASSVTATLGSTPGSGHLLVGCFFAIGGSSSTYTPPTGWTALGTTDLNGGTLVGQAYNQSAASASTVWGPFTGVTAARAAVIEVH